MLSKIINNTEEYKNKYSKNHRKGKGQFFTSFSIAKYMADACEISTDCISILDPGAGNGLLAAFLAYRCINNNLCKSIRIDYVESDPDILDLLNDTKSILLSYAAKYDYDLTINIISDNFILKDFSCKYDIIISNPPYKKIRKDSPEAIKMSSYVHGQPNLYSLFMAKGVELLKDNGYFIYITPRSWTSGCYYKKIREFLFKNIDISEIAIFESRTNIFDNEDVLQETMITIGKKSLVQSEPIVVKLITTDIDSAIELNVNSNIIKGVGEDNYLIIPSSASDVDVLRDMANIDDTFESLGYIFKTGPVVEFRNASSISEVGGPDKVPMFRSLHIVDGKWQFPVDTKKAQYISKEDTKLLLKNENTILLRRLSAKEDAKRLQCCVYKRQKGYKYISIENHVNYLTKKDGSRLTNDEITWISDILMSDEYDTYFKMISGSTQVNANDLNKLPLKRRIV